MAYSSRNRKTWGPLAESACSFCSRAPARLETRCSTEGTPAAWRTAAAFLLSFLFRPLVFQGSSKIQNHCRTADANLVGSFWCPQTSQTTKETTRSDQVSAPAASCSQCSPGTSNVPSAVALPSASLRVAAWRTGGGQLLTPESRNIENIAHTIHVYVQILQVGWADFA